MRKGKDPDPDPYIWLMDPEAQNMRIPQHYLLGLNGVSDMHPVWISVKSSMNLDQTE
jgi:hypothetical protein